MQAVPPGSSYLPRGYVGTIQLSERNGNNRTTRDIIPSAVIFGKREPALCAYRVAGDYHAHGGTIFVFLTASPIPAKRERGAVTSP